MNHEERGDITKFQDAVRELGRVLLDSPAGRQFVRLVEWIASRSPRQQWTGVAVWAVALAALFIWSIA